MKYEVDCMKDRLYTISAISAFVWLISILIFIGINLIASDFLSQDPDYSAGFEDHYLLLPMLIAIGVGFISFSIHFLTGVATLFVKASKRRPKFVPSIKAVYLTLTSMVVVTSLFLFIVYKNRPVRDFTGQQLMEAMNTYRVSKGLTKLDEDIRLCDNLVARWRSIHENNSGHDGFKKWLEEEGINSDGMYGLLAEMYVKSESPQNAINFWSGSPGHRLTLEDNRFTHICVYASQGTGVALLAEKK
jgi:uncharacterized protein YkwD